MGDLYSKVIFPELFLSTPVFLFSNVMHSWQNYALLGKSRGLNDGPGFNGVWDPLIAPQAALRGMFFDMG